MGKWLSSICLSALFVSACSDDDGPGGPTAGTGGTGTGAAGSSAGVSGAAGALGGSGGTAAAAGAAGASGAAGAGGSPGAGGSAGTGAGAGGSAAGATVLGSVQRPNPLISRTAATFSEPAGGNLVVDGNYHSNGWYVPAASAEAPAWVALQLSAGPTRLLLSWDDGGTYNYQDASSVTVYGLPGAYHIDVSADSTNGEDGTWDTVATVATNTVRTRAHSFEFAGKTWVKMVITAPPPNGNGGAVSIGEIDVHDISATGTSIPEDTWFFMGDSITAFAYDRAEIHAPSFATGISTAVPGYFPAMINGGIGAETTTDALARLAEALTLNPDYRFFILSYGTNDAAGGQIPVATFKANLQTMIDQIEAAGREPVIPHIPPSADGQHGTIPEYNTAIDELTTENGLIPGADMYDYFSTTPDLFTCPPCAGDRPTDNLHPNDTGLKGMNAEWSAAARGLYPE
jgi:acyl-CoA thioesterase I